MAVPAEAIMNVDEQNKIFAKAFKRIKLCTNGIWISQGLGEKEVFAKNKIATFVEHECFINNDIYLIDDHDSIINGSERFVVLTSVENFLLSIKKVTFVYLIIKTDVRKQIINMRLDR